MPITSIVDHNKCAIDVDRSLLMMKMECSNIHEAKRRALVMAYLTYDMTRHTFVKLCTASMLENPFDA